VHFGAEMDVNLLVSSESEDVTNFSTFYRKYLSDVTDSQQNGNL